MTDQAVRQDDRPRVLHLLKWLPRGGIETWLTHLFAHSVDGPVRHEMLLMQDEVGPLGAKVRSAGVPIHTLPVVGWGRWLVDLRAFLLKEGPFDVLHSHVDPIVSGPALAVARVAGVPSRIMHSHAAQSQGANYQSFRYKAREAIGSTIAAAVATRRIGISEMAIAQIAGSAWREQSDCTILYYGFDYSGFIDAGKRSQRLRRELAIPDDVTVVGHVGRFASQKNHRFLVDAFAAFAARNADAVLVLVGEGSLRGDVENQLRAARLDSRVRFVGGTDDIPAFMALFDIFVFPSFSEGLGIVVLEAQAGNVPTLMPDNMPREVIVVDEAVDLLPLSTGPETWAAAMDSILARPRPASGEWLRRVEESVFGMSRCLSDLNALYLDDLRQSS